MAMTIEELDEKINAEIDASRARVEASIKSLEQKIVDLVDEYNAGADVEDRIKSAREIQAKMIVEFEKSYGKTIKDLIDFSAIDRAVKSFTGLPLAGDTARALKAAAATTLDGYRSVSESAMSDINQAVLDYAIVGEKRDVIRDKIKSALSGSKDIAGKPMAVRAGTFVQDAIMKYHATANLLAAQKAGIKKFLYYGTIIETSRQFCIDHVGETKTLEEWEQLDNTSWAGKGPGGIMLARGGYGCRHHFVPVLK